MNQMTSHRNRRQFFSTTMLALMPCLMASSQVPHRPRNVVVHPDLPRAMHCQDPGAENVTIVDLATTEPREIRLVQSWDADTGEITYLSDHDLRNSAPRPRKRYDNWMVVPRDAAARMGVLQ